MAYYKMLGEKAMAQVSEEALFWHYNEESNSIAIMVQHLHGNMLSRWTDFLTTDGEKVWRQRDQEFTAVVQTREAVMVLWEAGWKVFQEALEGLTEEDLTRMIYIRNQGHTVMDAINRQLAHYPYHIGQIVFIAKMCAGTWSTLSIAKGQSGAYNANKFAQPKREEHFTREFLKDEEK